LSREYWQAPLLILSGLKKMNGRKRKKSRKEYRYNLWEMAPETNIKQ